MQPVFVSDAEQCSDFYRHLFDLESVAETCLPGEWRELDAGGCLLAFNKAYRANEPTGSPAELHKLVL